MSASNSIALEHTIFLSSYNISAMFTKLNKREFTLSLNFDKGLDMVYINGQHMQTTNTSIFVCFKPIKVNMV